MEDNKYYIPAIEDIRKGYECEIFTIKESNKNDNDNRFVFNFSELEKEWVFLTLRPLDVMWAELYIKKSELRTPYLTKEQIEKEGWENSESIDDDGAFEATKTVSGVIYKVTWTSDLHMQIWDTNFQHCVYYGTCPSINEFRTICKLLNIK